MTLKIVDASVAVKWFVPAETAGRQAALAMLDEIRVAPESFAVPELFFNEMLHVLCKLFTEASEIRSLMAILENLGWHRLQNGHDCLVGAVDLAKNHGLSGYDAIYAANARLVSGIWLTADERAHHKVAALKISRLLA